MDKTFIINEDTLNELGEVMKPSETKFNENMRYFFHQLKDDPVHAEVPTCIRMAGISRSRFLKMLEDRGIIVRTEKLNDKDKDGNFKKPTMTVKYNILDKIPDELEFKVSKTDFDRRIEKLRRSIFEKNLPKKKQPVQERIFNTPLGDAIACAKNNPTTIGFIAPPEKPYDANSWLMNRAVEAWNGELEKRKKKEQYIDEEGGGATGCCGITDGSNTILTPVIKGVVRRKLEEAVSDNSRYRFLGGGFDITTEDGTMEQSLVTIQNKKTGTLYHICFDGGNFSVYRDMRDGNPATHVSYVVDNLLDAFNNNGYVNVNEMNSKTDGRVFKISEEQMKAIEEATATTTIGGYTYDVPFGTNPSDEAMKRHNGEGGSVSINHVNDGRIGIHSEDLTIKRGEGKHDSHTVERINENSNKKYPNMDVKLRKGGRNAVKMSEEEFKEEMKHAYHEYAMEQGLKHISCDLQPTPTPSNFVYKLCYSNSDNVKSKWASMLHKDVWEGKYDFDSENVNAIGGVKMSSKGFPYIQCDAGGDWECPVCFFVYFDGTHFRAYIPIKGNALNRVDNHAFSGGGDENDAKFLAKEFGISEEEADKMCGDVRYNLDACLEDFLSRVEVKGTYKKRDFTKDEERFKEYRDAVKKKEDEEKARREEEQTQQQSESEEEPDWNGNVKSLVEQVIREFLGESKKKTHEVWLEEHGIKEEQAGLGFSEKEQKWYGWSHRGARGFGIGDKFRECYPTGTKVGKIIKTLEQAKEAAEKFANSVS